MQKEKTLTLSHGIDDDPSVSFMYGHRTAKDFNAAFKRDGWNGDPIRKDSLSFDYYAYKRGKYIVAKAEQNGSFPVTVMYW